jgi:hypothetical protein
VAGSQECAPYDARQYVESLGFAYSRITKRILDCWRIQSLSKSEEHALLEYDGSLGPFEEAIAA